MVIPLSSTRFNGIEGIEPAAYPSVTKTPPRPRARNAGSEYGPPTGIDHLLRAAPGEFPNPQPQVLALVIDGDHPGFQRNCEVHRRQPDHARGPQHDDPISLRHIGDRPQRVVCGAVGDAERGGFGEVDPVGHRRHSLMTQNRPLGERPGGRGAEHPVAGTQIHTVANGEDLTGQLTARNERHRLTDLVFAGDHQHIGEVHRGRANADQYLAGPRGRLGNICDGQALGWSVVAADDRAH
jgi:hypothetical protein